LKILLHGIKYNPISSSNRVNSSESSIPRIHREWRYIKVFFEGTSRIFFQTSFRSNRWEYYLREHGKSSEDISNCTWCKRFSRHVYHIVFREEFRLSYSLLLKVKINICKFLFNWKHIWYVYKKTFLALYT